jgi:uncharacterized lipoprotein YbaY
LVGGGAVDASLLAGRVVIAGDTPALERAAVHVRLEAVGAADAASTLVAETIVRGIAHDAGGGDTVIPFSIRGPDHIDPDADYALRVWVDRDGDGEPGPGDLYSDERWPVLTRGFGRTAEIHLAPRGVPPIREGR